ncbi:MAG TPA: response regulator transcription factor [Bryobacteraceae bacterium]|nr:response regulator transcription factor [Bryobacteraceae bacterium]
MLNSRRVRVLLADDHVLVAAGLAKLLEDDFEVLGIRNDGREAVDAACQERPDVVVLDISMRNLNGLEAARQIKAARPETKIVFITVHADLAYVAAAFRGGASGYVLKGSASSELREAIYQALSGNRFLTPLISQEALDEVLSHPSQSLSLTPRQREILQLVAEGHSAKTIGYGLHISAKTVEFHKAEIMKKLKLHSVAALTRYAIEHGISA